MIDHWDLSIEYSLFISINKFKNYLIFIELNYFIVFQPPFVWIIMRSLGLIGYVQENIPACYCT